MPETTLLYQKIRTQVIGAAVAIHSPNPSPLPFCPLPHTLTELIGRNESVAAVAAALAERRLVTLTGPGGVGKTKLALAVAEVVREEFRDGVRLIELASVADPNLVPLTIAIALGLQEESSRPVHETLVDVLRSRSLLLVLDNCEHLRDACAEIVHTLLSRCLNLRILSTSRQSLGLMGERRWPVPTLSCPPQGHNYGDHKQGHGLKALISYSSIYLFRERARDVDPNFAVTAENAADLAAICRLLEGIPLAIELTAARISTLSLPEIRSGLSDCLSLLTNGSRTAFQRHKTLQELIDWSFHLLDSRECVLLARLSIFSGGWTPEAAEHVCSGNGLDQKDIRYLLEQLTSKSLCTISVTGQGVRYRLLEPIRQYSASLIRDIPERAMLCRLHQEYFADWMAHAGHGLRGHEQKMWLARIDTELDNLRIVLGRGSFGREEAQVALRVSGQLWRFWQMRGLHTEGRNWYAKLLAQSAGYASAELRSDALIGAGLLAREQGDWKDAESLLREGLTTARNAVYPAGMALALNGLGNVANARDDGVSARMHFEESLVLWKEAGDLWGTALALTNLAGVASSPEEGWSLQQQSLALRRQIGDHRGVTRSLINLALWRSESESTDETYSLLNEALRLARELDDKPSIAWALRNLGNLARQNGELEAAQTFYYDSMVLRRDLGDRKGLAFIVWDLAAIAEQQNSRVKSQGLYMQGLVLFQGLGQEVQCYRCLERLGFLAAVEPTREDAVRLLGNAFALREAAGTPQTADESSACNEVLAQMRCAMGKVRFEKAWKSYQAMSLGQVIDYLQSVHSATFKSTNF